MYSKERTRSIKTCRDFNRHDLMQSNLTKGLLSIMVIVKGNEISNPSSNLGQNCLHFYFVLIMPLGKA